MFIKLVSIKELYYDARPTKSQEKLHLLVFLLSNLQCTDPWVSNL